MAFYTANWIKQLVKEDHKDLLEHIKKKDNDFRSYIDSTLPFTLYLDINIVRKNILLPESAFIQGLTQALNIKDGQLILKELDLAYQKTINYYIDSYPTVTSDELSTKLNELRDGITSGNIKSTIQKVFKTTFTVSNLSKKNQRVLIVSPKFTTIQSKFGSLVKSNFNYDNFSDTLDYDLNDSPRNIIRKYLNGNFSVLNNLGHAEIDIISSVKGSTEVKRGLVTPRLLQALVDLPKAAKPEALARKFSKDTGQGETRIEVRKVFTGSKVVLEMLIEAGIQIGTTESQKSNLNKAKDERAFLLGKNLTSRILKDPTIITNLETSKSLIQYLNTAIVNAIKNKDIEKYTSKTSMKVNTKITRAKVVVSDKKSAKIVALPKLKCASEGSVFNSISLQNLLNTHLQDMISANMGDGDSRNVLNYRTGRLAASAKVERLTSSREGLITSFYSYQKNPYATFSDGGRQQYPKTRDPKLLISKSIREIAAEYVSNQLRSVNI